jgi:hypothetical protein
MASAKGSDLPKYLIRDTSSRCRYEDVGSMLRTTEIYQGRKLGAKKGNLRVSMRLDCF